MNADLENVYHLVRSGRAGFHEQERGLIAVWGKEAVQFLDGMITNDVKTLADGAQMLAAFPNAQGRLIAVVRMQRQGERLLIETEDATREKVFQNLFRFTFAGDFYVEDLSDSHRYVELFGARSEAGSSQPGYSFFSEDRKSYFAPKVDADLFVEKLIREGEVRISESLYETLRIESGIPKYGFDMDETTVVPEIGWRDLFHTTKAVTSVRRSSRGSIFAGMWRKN